MFPAADGRHKKEAEFHGICALRKKCSFVLLPGCLACVIFHCDLLLSVPEDALEF